MFYSNPANGNLNSVLSILVALRLILEEPEAK